MGDSSLLNPSDVADLVIIILLLLPLLLLLLLSLASTFSAGDGLGSGCRYSDVRGPECVEEREETECVLVVAERERFLFPVRSSAGMIPRDGS